MRLGLLCALLMPLAAFAQDNKPKNPDEDWAQMPGEALKSQPPPPTPPPSVPPGPVAMPPPSNGAPPPPPVGGLRTGAPRPPDEPNRVSMFGAPTLKQWNRGETA